MILAGDIGGTKTALGIYSSEKGMGTPLARETFASANYACLEDIVAEFRLKFDFEIEKAAFGVAGPVSGGKAVIRNYPAAGCRQSLCIYFRETSNSFQPS